MRRSPSFARAAALAFVAGLATVPAAAFVLDHGRETLLLLGGLVAGALLGVFGVGQWLGRDTRR